MKHEYFSKVLEVLESPFFRFLVSILPAIAAVLLLYSMGPEVYLPAASVFIAFYFAVGLGWIVSPAVALGSGLSPVGTVVLLVFISSQSSLILSLNYDLLEKIPLIGRYMKKLRTKAGEVIEKREAVKNIGYLSIFWLMFLPVYGTGPNVMTLVGRLLGMEWKRVWMVITLSATVRFALITSLMYLGYMSI